MHNTTCGHSHTLFQGLGRGRKPSRGRAAHLHVPERARGHAGGTTHNTAFARCWHGAVVAASEVSTSTCLFHTGHWHRPGSPARLHLHLIPGTSTLLMCMWCLVVICCCTSALPNNILAQERATKISHRNTARQALEHGDETLAALCGAIAGDEGRHEAAYSRIIGEAFRCVDRVTTFQRH